MSAQPAHRPSRRDEIVAAAIKIFAKKGYAEASISDIAEEASVAVTAVYYHFTGKDELFTAAMRSSLASISAVVLAIRPTAEQASIDALELTIEAVWDWIDANPDAATLVHVQLPGTTRQLAALREEFLELHESRAVDYFTQDGPRGRRSGANRGAGMLTIRTLVDALIAVHAMRLGDGPLSTASDASLRTETRALARRLLT